MRLLALGVLACLLACASARDYYDLLQVPRSADEAQIKRAYRKVALKYHPDKVQGSEEEKAEAAKKFAEIGHAYEVLTDEKKRKVYDQYGEEGLKSMQGGGGFHNPNDVFSQFFGGRFGGFGWGGQQGEPETPKGDTVRTELEVSLKDLYTGVHLTVLRDKAVLKPAEGTRKCNCKNKVVTQQLGPGMYQQYTTQVCEDCPNVRYERQQEPLTVHVEPGMPDGHEVTFFEEGEPLVDGETGDLVLRLVTAPHPRFARSGNDLLLNATISLLEALTGFERQVQHLDGHNVTLSSTGVTRPGRTVTIKGEGMPVLDKMAHGDLHVTYSVSFPKELSASQAKQLKDLLGQVEWAHDEL